MEEGNQSDAIHSSILQITLTICEEQCSDIMQKVLTSEPSLPLFYGYNSFQAPQFISKTVAFL